jgi:KDO2-lipid IV(A) lauroyltransferase
MKVITAVLFFIFIWLFALIPFFLLYQISNVFYLLLYYVFGYRKKIILKNLTECFPNKSEKEIKALLPSIYINLTDNILEGIKAFTMTSKQIVKRHKIINPEIFEDYFKKGQSIIAVAGHYGNWEWGSISASLQTNYNMVALYKPLSNKLIDNFISKSRQRSGTVLASMFETSETFKKHKDTPSVFLMAADQSPGRKYIKKAHWIKFLGRDTAFLHGPEKYAKNNNYPVMYVDVQRVRRGYYEVELSILADKPMELKDGELTALFAKKLESIINTEPVNWLWSHNRWKLTR